MKKTKIFAIVVFVIAIIVVAFKVKDHYENKVWYEFADDMKKEYPIIKSLDKTDYGPYTAFWIYLREDKAEIEKVEKMLEGVFHKLNNEKFLEYIQEYHNQHASGEFSFIDIVFKYQNEESEIMYELESVGKERPYYSRFNLWRGIDESVIGRKYDLSDYK